MQSLLNALGMTEMTELTSSVMLILFASSWVFNITKSIRARTAKGKSVIFELIIYVGYIIGAIGFVAMGKYNFTFYCYLLDLVMVTIDLSFTFRNMRLDKKSEK